MNDLSVILLPLLLLAIGFIIFCAITDKVMTKRQFKIIWGYIVILMFFMALSFVPKDFIDWDLLRLYKHLNNIRVVGIEQALKYTEYRNLYVVKYWMDFVAKTNNNNLFTAFPLFLDFTIYGYIFYDVFKKKGSMRIAFKDFLTATFLWICLMGIKLAVSDVRCVFAMSISCLAFYKEYICSEKKIFSYALYVVAIFTHHFAIVFLIYRVVLTIKRITGSTKTLLIIFIFSQLIIYSGAQFLYEHSNIFYLREIARKLLADWNIYGFTTYFFSREMSMKILYLCFVTVFIAGYIWSNNKRKAFAISYSTTHVNEIRINDALFVLSCIGIGFSFNYLLLERFLYISAYIFVLHYLLDSNREIYIGKVIRISPILLYILYFNDINIFIVNYIGHYIF